MEFEAQPSREDDSPVEAFFRWFTERPVVFTTLGGGIEKGMNLEVTGCVNSSLNGTFRVTKVRRGWLHWYDPILNFVQRSGQEIRRAVWRAMDWIEEQQ